MRNKGVVIVLTVVITFLCLYYLQFTWVARNVQKDAVAFATTSSGNLDLNKKQRFLDSLWNKTVYTNLFGVEYTYKEVKENELGLGLDLQGGMHVVLEISPVDIIRGLSTDPNDPGFAAALQKAREAQKTSQGNFVDLFYDALKDANPSVKLATYFASSSTQGRISLSDDDDTVIKLLKEEVQGAIDRSFTILKTRIDQFGTSSPNIQQLPGSGRIQIEIPGADNPQRVRKLLQGVARLEFWNVVEAYDPDLNRSMQAINQKLLAEKSIADITPNATTGTTLSADTTQSALEQKLSNTQDSLKSALDSIRSATNSPIYALMTPGSQYMYSIKDTSTLNSILRRADIKAMLPRDIGFFWDVKVNEELTPTVSDDITLNFVRLGRGAKPLLTGETIVDARLDYDQYARPSVSMRMNAAGSKVWAKVTSQAAALSPQGRIAIVLDNFVYSAPTVQGEIPTGNSQITGNFTVEEAKDLALILKAGSLPAPTRIVEEGIVWPSLGKVAQNQGILSIVCGLALVVIFMVAYYSKGGLVANIALLFNIFFVLGIMAQPQLHTALTLPGIAGIVLTMGMAVDANVLIYERIREELKAGRKMVDAINKGFERAFASIFDSNLTTFLTAMFLFIFGSGPIRGFAITLMIGIATSFFTAVYISRVIIEWMVRKGDESKISFSTFMTSLVPNDANFDFMGFRKKAYLFSGTFILIGFILIAIQGLNYGVDFKGGRSYTLTFKNAIEATAMRNSLSESFEGTGLEVKNYNSSNMVKVTTSYLADDESDAADDKVRTALIAGVAKYTGMEFQENAANVDDKHFTIGSSSKVGATIADDIKNSSLLASLTSILGIFLYILIRFKKWQYSTGAIVALIHDTMFVFSAFAIARVLGLTFEVDQVFVAAILTIIGYSINDTVIIFDRIREYVNYGSLKGQATIFNAAINHTLSRTVITSGATLLVVIVLLIFGGEVLRGFAFALLIGIGIGTYSSIFIAAPIILDLDKQKPAEVKA
jgi:SecD/SecF fusion protein